MDSRQSPVLRTPRSRLSVAISLAALGIAASLVSAPVLALCSPGSPTGGETLTCDFTATDYFATANNLTFEINSGALVTSGTTGTPSMFLNGDGFTINNRGTIDSAFNGFATTSTTALKIWSTGLSPITVNNLLLSSPIRGSAATQTGPLASLDGMALDIRNGAGSLITVDNKGLIMAVRVSGNTAITTDIPVVALYGGGQISMINSGTITGRVAFESSAAGNTFTNIGALNGSLSMGAAGGNRFNAVTNSSISTFGGVAGTLTNTAGINLEFAPTGVVDGGVAGNNGLYLQNAPNGGSGSSGTGTIYAASYINFSNLQVLSGTWTVNGALLTGTTTSAGLSGGVLKVNNNAVFGSGDVTVNGATITAEAASLVLANKFALGANFFSGIHGLTVNGTNTLTIDGVISGTSVATLTKNDAGVLRLNGVNTYSGTTYLNSGTLIAGSNLAFGTSLLSVGSGGKIEGAGASITNNINLTGGATFGGSGDLSVGGIISNTGTQSITKSGSGALTLSNANTFQGGTLLSAGTLSVGNNQALGSGDLTVDGASTLASTGSVTLNNKVALAANLTVGGDNNITLNNVVSGGLTAKLIKTGNGNLVLGGTNNFQGGIELNGGTVTASNNNGGLGSGTLTVTGNGRLVYGTALLAMTPIVINSGKTLEFSNDVSVLYNGLISGGGDLVKTGSESLELFIATTLSGLVDVRQGTLKSAVPNALGNNPNLNIDSGASVKIDYGAGIKSLTGAGEITVNSGPLIIGNGNASSTFDGVISGPGAVSKTGTGLLTLSGISSHTGTTTVNGGRLDIASGASLASSSVTVNNGGSISGRGSLSNALVINNGGHLALSSGSTLTSGALTLSSGSIVDIVLGAPTIATPMAKVNGDLVINASPIFNFTDAGNMANGTYRLFDYTGLLTYTGGTLGTLPPGILAGEVQLEIGQNNVVNIIVNSALLARQYWDGTPSPANGNIEGGSGVWTAGNANWTNASGLGNDVWKGVSAVFQNSSGTVSILGTHTISALLFKSDGYVLYADPNNGLSLVNGTGGSALVTVDSGNTATLDTAVVGAGKLEKSGAGTLVLTRSNSYSGGTALAAGTLLVRDDNALGNGALSLASGTTLRSDRVEAQLANSVSVTGASNIDVTSGTLSLNGVVSGAGGLVKVGAGNLVLNGNNAQLGNTSLTAGGLVLGNANALGAGILTTSSNTTLDSGLAGVQIGSNVAMTGNLTFLGSRDMSLTGVVSGSGNLIKNGSSTLSLTGANSLNGTVTLNQGTLRLGQSAALGNASLVVGGASSLEAGGNVSVAKTVNLQANLTVTGANDLTFADALYGAGGLIKDGSGKLTLSALNLYQGATILRNGTVVVGGNLGTGLLAVTGNATLETLALPPNQAVTLDNADVAIGSALTVNTAGRLVMSGTVSGAGSLTKTGAETLSLTNSSTFQGIYNINGGSLAASLATSLGNPTQVNIASGASLLLANGGTTAQLDGAGSVQLGGGNFRVGAGTFSGDMSVTSGSGGLTKFGNGTLSLSGNNTLNTIVVDGGTLRFNGQGSASVTVQNGAMLAGSGALTGGVTVANGGHLGLAAGSVLNLHSLVLNDTSNLDVTLGAAVPGAAGLANISHNLTLDGRLNITDTGGFGIGVYRLFDYNGSLINNELELGALPIGTPANELEVQTSVARQINLVVGGSSDIRFWDGSQLTGNGSVEGGNGIWTSASTNWTTVNAGLNGAWNGSFAVFQGTAGTVTVDGTQSVTGLQFVSDGYQLVGGATDSLQLLNGGSGYSTLRVDNGVTATLDVNLGGSGVLNKVDSGTLVLNGSNTYSGDTRLSGGTLVLGNNAALGSGSLTSAAGTTLDSNTAVSLANDLNLNGALTLAGSHDLTLNGVVLGTGTLEKNGSSTLTLNQANGYAGTTLNAGKLMLGNSAALGSGALAVAGAGGLDTSAAMTLANAIDFGVSSGSSLTLAGNHDLTLSGALSGNGTLVKQGASTLDLTGSSNFSGVYQIDAGRLNLLGSNGSSAPQVSVGTGATLGVAVDSTLHQLSGQGAVQLSNNSALTLRNGTYAGSIGGTGSLNIASGIVALTGTSSISGATNVASGMLFAHGALTTSSLSVANGATLGGKGSVNAAVTVADGGHLQLLRSNTLTTGALTLNNASNLDAVLGTAVVGDAGMIKVNGNLVLDGRLNVTDAGAFGMGVYRLIDYTGALTDNGLELGVIPANLLASELSVQSSIDKQVNLVVGGGADLRFWNGGTGRWNSSSSNWANSSGGANQVWNNSFAVFQGAAGVVTVEGAQRFGGLQFMTGGYQLVAGSAGELVAINSPAGYAGIRVDSGKIATLGVNISGSGTLAKLDSGTLVLNGSNSYSGGTRLDGGTLVLGNNAALGSGSLRVAAGTTLDSNSTLNVSNGVILDGSLSVAGSRDLTLAGQINGNGGLIKNGSNVLRLDGNNSYQGNTLLNAGTLVLGHNNALGSSALVASGTSTLRTAGATEVKNAIDVAGNLTVGNASALTLSGRISGNGTLVKDGVGSLDVLDGGGFSGLYSVNNGRLNLLGGNGLGNPTINIGAGGSLGVGASSSVGQLSGAGSVELSNNSLFTVNGGNYNGPIVGAGSLKKTGTGSLVLSRDSSVSGTTDVSQGSLYVNGSLRTSSLTVANGATLGGTGSISGTVAIADGGHVLLNRGATLTTGALTLNNNSRLDAFLGAVVPAAAGLIKTNGNLVLDGQLNVTDLGGFGQGVYRLIDYTGSLTNNGLTIGTVPGGLIAGDLEVQTSVANQVNLVVGGTAGGVLFWDGNATANGAINGGSGVWGATATNWTNASGNVNQAWNNGFAVFQGNPGTVVIEGGQTVSGLQFMTDGYRLAASAGGGYVGFSNLNIRVDGSNTATLDVNLSGSGGTLSKQGSGTLVLNGNNWNSKTDLHGGTLVLGSSSALGGGAVEVKGTATLDNSRAVTLHQSLLLNGDLTIAGSNELELRGNIQGDHKLTKNGDAALLLRDSVFGQSRFTGSVVLNAGSLILDQFGDATNVTALGQGALTVQGNSSLSVRGISTFIWQGLFVRTLRNDMVLNAQLSVSQADYQSLQLGGNISGAGTLIKNGAGTLQLMGSGNFSGNLVVNAGRLNVYSDYANANVHIASGAVLENRALIGGQVTLADGATMLAYSGRGQSTGNLSFAAGSQLNAYLGAPNDPQALIKVNGNLVLDGTLNIVDSGGFGQGVYRLFDYSGSLTDNGLLLGSLPAAVFASDLEVQTRIGNQVNLVVGAGAGGALFWIDGNGSWGGAQSSWNNASGNLAQGWNSGFAVFQGGGETVTVEGQQTITGLQFASNGYTLAAGDAGELNLINGGAGYTGMRVGSGNTASIDVNLTGSGTLNKLEAGTLALNGNNSYSGGTQLNGGTLVLGHNAALGSGALSVLGNSGLDTSGNLQVGNAIVLGAQFTLGGSHDLTLSGAISGNGDLIKNGSGQLLLSGTSSYTGNTSVNAGNLSVTGSFASANVQVANGASLGGSGTLSGQVSLADGASLNAASATAPLTLGGLSLASTSNLNFALGVPDTQVAVVKVNGDLVLNGKLNISNAGGFGSGVYQLFSYGGVLTGNGLSLGNLPSGFFAEQMTLQTALANQINLVVGEADGSLLFWNGDKTSADGSIVGGNGVWGPDTNWTNSTGSNASNWAGGQFAVFGGQSGTVTVQGARTFSGLQFLSDGYQVVAGAGDSLEAINAADGSLAGIRVADAATAVIGAQLLGDGGIEKLDGGTLVLTGNNSYSGGTVVSGGTLSGSTASLQGGIVNNASLIFQQDVDGRFSGTLGGTGAAFKRGAGTLLFTGYNDFSGTFSVDQGVLQVGETAASQSPPLPALPASRRPRLATPLPPISPLPTVPA